MHNLYCSDDDELLALSSCAAQALIGFSVSQDICEEYDVLNLEEFKSVVNYIVKLYRECRNKKTVSGEHEHFGAYVGGHAYLLYFFECLKETGDTALMNCAYGELDNNLQRTSSDPPKARFRRGSSYASDHSISPMPSTNSSLRSQRQSAVATAEDAANLIIEKQKQSVENDRFDRMMEMSDKFE